MSEPTYQRVEIFDSVNPAPSKTSVSFGHGCFGLGTPIMLASGKAVPVEEIRIGDRIMGADGASTRNVFELRRSRQSMYRFTYMDGTSHVFNESHILCLVATNSKGRRVAGQKITVTVGEWLKWGDDKKRCHAIYRSPVQSYEREQKPLPIPPYVLGAWLGDGHSQGSKFTTADLEIKAAFAEYAAGLGYSLVKQKSNSGMADIWSIKQPGIIGRGRKNVFMNFLRGFDLIGNKHIPDDYLYASREDRLELLAGLLDTDGHQDKGSHGFEITQKNAHLALQIVTLARSVGCHATVKEVTKTCGNNGVKGQYWRVTIGRNIDQIPIRIPHKKITPGERQRPNLHFGIRFVEPLGEGDYYGFVLDDDSRFLGGDFTVLHNTGKTWTRHLRFMASAVLF